MLESSYALQGRAAGPFLKWAGGKRQLLRFMLPRVPQFDRYFEPFLGGGSLFFALFSSRSAFPATLADTNLSLIETYEVVRDDVAELIDLLSSHQAAYSKNPEKYYYELRAGAPMKSKIQRAARFIALNRTCYNGLYRVNSKGEFNVPIGRYKNPQICRADVLRKCSGILATSETKLVVADYEKISRNARGGDFVYLDPPFSPVSETARFVNYTREGFDLAEQKRLAQVFRDLDRRGCKVMLSNSDTCAVRDLYEDFADTTTDLDALRSINCDGSARRHHAELLVCNYATS